MTETHVDNTRFSCEFSDENVMMSPGLAALNGCMKFDAWAAFEIRLSTTITTQ